MCAASSPVGPQQVTVALHGTGTAVQGILIPWHPLELAVFPCAILAYQSPLPGWMSHVFLGRLILSLTVTWVFILPCPRILVGLPASTLITTSWKGNKTVLDCDSFFCFVNSELVGVVSQMVIAHW